MPKNEQEFLQQACYAISGMLQCDAVSLMQGVGGGVLVSSLLEMHMRGVKRIGRGHFSVVCEHPTDTDKVIKISTNPRDGGVMYAFWARNNKEMKGVPTIYSIRQERVVLRNWENESILITFIIMKKYKKTIMSAYKDDIYTGADLSDIHDCARSRFRGGSDEYLSNDYGEIATLWYDILGIDDTLQSIRKFFSGAYGFDLHDENIMLDENDEWIIIDPLSHKKEKTNA